MKKSLFVRLAWTATAVAVVVVVLGAFVRLTDAGLGCPDWPGCYGHIGVPDTPQQIAAANAAFPQRPVEIEKAWYEMIHRYLASGLGLVILIMAYQAWRHRDHPKQLVALPLILVALVIAQGMLGMWTVTMLLKPAIVTAHLIGGMTTTALLWWVTLRQQQLWLGPAPKPTLPAGVLGLGVAILALQIALGGWTSTNYAALACPDFPTCHGQWLPMWDAANAFKVWHGLGVDYEGGILSNEARVTIHAVHRLGALVAFLYIGGLTLWVISRASGAVRTAAGTVLVLLLIQVGLGISNIVYSLPLPVAVAHTGVALLLLLAMVTLVHLGKPRAVA